MAAQVKLEYIEFFSQPSRNYEVMKMSQSLSVRVISIVRGPILIYYENGVYDIYCNYCNKVWCIYNPLVTAD